MVKRAFTLLELAVVVCILGIILLFSTNHFKNLQDKLSIKNQAEEIVAVLETARQSAQNKNETVEIIFDYDEYRLETEQSVIKVYKLQPGFSTEAQKLGFTADGNTAFAGTVLLLSL